MSRRTEHLDRELRRLDPVGPNDLDRALEAPAAGELLDRIVSLDPEVEARPEVREPRRRRRIATLTLVPLAAAVAAVVMFVLIGSPGDGSGEDQAAAALEGAAAVAASQQQMAAETTYTFLKTREVSLEGGSAGGRSWSVHEPTVREEWVAGDGSGRLRTVSGPARFLKPRDRAAWEAAGSPDFLPLGLERRTEDRWLAAGLLAADLEELPTNPVTLAAHLRREAQAESGEVPVPARMLQLIATDLRNPGASPELRQALFLAAARVPGIEYLGREADPDGRTGVAVAVTGSQDGEPLLYSLIFEPRTATVLAGEVNSAKAAGNGGSGSLQRAIVYLGAHAVDPGTGFGAAWLSSYDSSAPWQQSDSTYLVYHVPARDPWLRNLDQGRGVR